MPSPIIKKMDSMSKRVTDLLPSTKGGILTNKWILYLVLFFAIFDVFHFYQKGDLQSVMIFFIVGILVSFFSKNMVVILIIAIASTHMIRYGKRLTEGFKDDDEEFADKGEETEEFEGETDETEKPKEDFEGETDKTEKPKKTEMLNKEAMNAINNTSNTVNQMAAQASSADDISQQTKELLTTQKELMKNMEILEPLLSKADTFTFNNNKKEKFTSLAEAYANHGSVTTKPTSK
jgi:hypothetical protein